MTRNMVEVIKVVNFRGEIMSGNRDLRFVHLESHKNLKKHVFAWSVFITDTPNSIYYLLLSRETQPICFLELIILSNPT